MLRKLIPVAVLAMAAPAFADDALPAAISCYQTATNGKNIDAYMACFTDDAEMIDVSRTFQGKDAIRAWAEREVMPGGQSFKHRAILESDPGYAKTEVNWASWVAHYHYWWNDNGKITKMSLQYAD
ncbi:nuclear transport factor 2 family protein [Ruegeria sp. R14_0]|uniref:nuclear transport factor 2 family protein n=1 Tax=Ruegeria sp. R14_0 TaxID=2821100 RepID=UPI001AD9DDC6|nr:nuclear transport factor 2 family protein [Ruegeria sp. R14_0]MBO9446907.1 nuclear transport factor 2 family protein [Ruegeria sp. R14_0]